MFYIRNQNHTINLKFGTINYPPNYADYIRFYSPHLPTIDLYHENIVLRALGLLIPSYSCLGTSYISESNCVASI